ncbi:MAG: NAD(P)/FAD-dependent oxidoreductase [Campylobacterales bacterium]
MQNKELDMVVEQAREEIKKSGASRRDVLKLAGIGGAAMMMAGATQEAEAATKAKAAVSGRVVVIGGGFAGLSFINKFTGLADGASITLIEPSETCYYQPGYTLIAADVYQPDDVVYNTADYVPSDVKWLKTSVTECHPDENYLVTQNGQKVEYDYLVVTPGLQLNFDGIEGFSEDVVGKNGISCLYTWDGSQKTEELMIRFCEQGGKGVFTHPNTPIKCGGAPKKIQFLTDGYARKIGTRDKMTLDFYAPGGGYFGVPEYAKLIEDEYKKKDLGAYFKHTLTSIDPSSKEATFSHAVETMVDEYDPILEETVKVKKTSTEVVNVPFDFIHVTPPMSAPDAIKSSKLAWQKGSAAKGGWVELEPQTLQHTRYPNVFGLGDVAGIPLGKTGGSIRKQYPVAAQNLADVMAGKEPSAKYDGYTVCPLITDYGEVAMLEFDWTDPSAGVYSGKMAPSLPLNPLEPHWLYWVLKVYMLKPMTMYGMLKGMA